MTKAKNLAKEYAMQVLSRTFLVLTLVLSAFVVSISCTLADNAQVDQAIYASLREVINQGADLFNINADHAGCYRVYEGALISVKPLLGHHPDLQKAIEDGLADASKLPKVADRAFALRKVLDAIRTKVKMTVAAPIPTPPPPLAKVSLWDRLDGKSKLPRLVDEFVTEVAGDPRIDLTRTGKRKIDVDKVKLDTLAFIANKAGAETKSTLASFQQSLNAEHLEDFELSLVIAAFKEKLRRAGISTADSSSLLKALEITHRPITIAPVAPNLHVERKVEPRLVTLWERLRGPERMPSVVDGFVTVVAADPRIDLARAGKKPVDVAQMKAAVLAYISKKTGANVASAADSFKDALNAGHLQDFEFSLAVLAFKDRLKSAGIEKADADTLLQAIDVSYQPLTVVPVAPKPHVELPVPPEPAPKKSPPVVVEPTPKKAEPEAKESEPIPAPKVQQPKKTEPTFDPRKVEPENKSAAFDDELVPFAAIMAIGSRSLSGVPGTDLAIMAVAQQRRPD